MSRSSHRRLAASPVVADARAQVRGRQKFWALILAVVGALQLFVASISREPEMFVFLGVVCCAISLLYFWATRRYGKLGSTVDTVNSAYVDLVAGREAEAERKLDEVAARAKGQRYVLRAVALQRTLLAMRRGRLEAAIEHASAAIEGKTRFATFLGEGLQIVEARALRALALASLGRAEDAAADARMVESSPLLGPSALARVSLSRAVLMARTGRSTELHAHYAAEGESLVEELGPRERTLSRALRRMGQPRARSVYREAAVLDEEDDEAALQTRDWVRKIAPDAARFVPAAARGPRVADRAPPVPPATTSRPRGVEETASISLTGDPSRFRGRAAGQGLLLSIVVMGAFFAAWQVLTSSDHSPHPGRHGHAPPPSLTDLVAAPLAFASLAFATLLFSQWWKRRTYQRQMRTIQRAQLALARGDSPRAIEDLNRVAHQGGVGLGPSAYLALARESMRRGDFSAAVQACTAGVVLTSSTLQAKAAHQDILLPELLSTLAFALAAEGRVPEARDLLARIERDHPRFPYRARGRYRVDLLDAVTRGDLHAAARVVAEREPEMSVDLRVDLLGEVAAAAAVGGLHDEAADALRSELSAMPRVASWIEQVAPGLAARIGRGQGLRVATPFVSREEALHEEDTIRLDDEAAQLLALGARRLRT